MVKKKICWIIVITLLLGILPRMYLLPIPNNDDDMMFQVWIRHILRFGLHNIYNPLTGMKLKAMHPPLNYCFLRFIGSTFLKFFSSSIDRFDLESCALMILCKIPNLLFDLLIATLIFCVILKHKYFKMAYLALCFYLFNPAMIWEAGYVGQIESIQALFMLLAVVFLDFGKIELSWIAITLGILTKFQTFILVPLILFLSIKKFPVKRILRSTLLSLLVAFIILLPWIYNGQLPNVVRIYTTTIDTYPFISINACNIWGLWSSFLYDKFSIGFGDGSGTIFTPDNYTIPYFPFFSYKQLGIFLFSIWYIMVIYCLNKKQNRVNLYLCTSIICFAFFMLPTQIHERYLFPFFSLFAIILFRRKIFTLIYIALSISFLLNLYMSFPLANVTPHIALTNPNNPLFYNYLSFPLNISSPLTAILCFFNLGLFLLLTLYMFIYSNRADILVKKVNGREY